MQLRCTVGWHCSPSYSHIEAGLMAKLRCWPLSRPASRREPHAVSTSWCYQVTDCSKYLVCTDIGSLSPAAAKCQGLSSSLIYNNLPLCMHLFLKPPMDNWKGRGREEKKKKNKEEEKKDKFKRKHFSMSGFYSYENDEPIRRIQAYSQLTW